ncbi:MAG: hypothetical protein RSA79_06840 [Oscillospiraceae bacterium]
MKTALKVIGIITGAIIVAKIVQILIDVLYDSYGKRYITADNEA